VARLQRRRFSDPDEVRRLAHGSIEVVSLDDRVIGRMTYEPGWRWSVDVKPIAGTESCQFHHVGVTLAGRLRVQTQDGVELELAPGDVFEIPPGHDAWVVGDEPWVSVDFEAMRAYALPRADGGRRVLMSILFSDIVESTARAVLLGSDRWRQLVGTHNELAERVIDEFGGRLVKTTGDGAIGVFDSAERAVHAASALVDRMAGIDLRIRVAVNTGEVELIGGDARGLAVHTAARLLDTARPDEVVVSSTVRDLVDGSELEFEDHGVHELKGLPGERRLYHLVRNSQRRSRPPAGAH